MAIPGPIDFKLAEIDAIAQGVTTQLRILRHGPGRDLGALRERVQEFADVAMEAGREIINSKK